MKTVALYLRVSSLDQHPETQLYDLRAMAQQRGFKIVAEYTDRISGTKARRPGLDELLRDARRGRFQVLLVWASDRIARSVRHFLEVLDELNHLNIEFVSFRENLDTGGPLGRAVIIIIGTIAELERNLIIERVRAGMRRARLEGIRARVARDEFPLLCAGGTADHRPDLAIGNVSRRINPCRRPDQFSGTATVRHQGIA